MTDKVPETEEEWREKLSAEAYHILREGGTEPRNSSDLLHTDENGKYHCKGCGQAVFSSADKFDSGTGWPSFTDAIDDDRVTVEEDDRLPQKRIEVQCSNCGSHLGHVFDDGPEPTGKRYCINGAALTFHPDTEESSQ